MNHQIGWAPWYSSTMTDTFDYDDMLLDSSSHLYVFQSRVILSQALSGCNDESKEVWVLQASSGRLFQRLPASAKLEILTAQSLLVGSGERSVWGMKKMPWGKLGISTSAPYQIWAISDDVTYVVVMYKYIQYCSLKTVLSDICGLVNGFQDSVL